MRERGREFAGWLNKSPKVREVMGGSEIVERLKLKSKLICKFFVVGGIELIVVTITFCGRNVVILLFAGILKLSNFVNKTRIK